MAEFVASSIANAGFDPQDVQRNALNIQAQQQDLADRATFRQNALGLLNRDPNATAAAIGANPQAGQAYLSSIPNADANTRAQSVSDTELGGAAAGAVLNAPPDQRAAVWQTARQAMINGGHTNVPGPDYPGDANLMAMRATALTAQQQLAEPLPLTATPVRPLQSVPGGGSVGPGGVQQGAAPAAAGGVTATPLAAPDGSQPGPTGQSDGSFQAGLAQRESSGNPAALNPAKYAGLYQFGTQRLASLGMYQPAPGESTTTNQWKGTVSIPGYPQVQTLSQFLGNPAAQNAAYSAHMADIDSAIAATPGAQNFDQNGLRAVAHLGGTGAMQQFVASGGRANAADSNSTSWANYYNHFSAPGSTPVRVASAANTAGMPQTANDASPAPAPAAAPAIQPAAPVPPPSGNALNIASPAPAALPASTATTQPARPVLPVTPHGSPPASGYDDPAMLVKADSPEAAAGLPFNTRFMLPDGTVRTAGVTNHLPPPSQGARPAGYGANGDPAFTPSAPANLNPALAGVGGRTDGGGPATLPLPAPAAPAITPQAAVQQASTELGASLNGMAPDAANAAVQTRAQQIMAGGGQPPQQVQQQPAPAPAAPVQQVAAPVQGNALGGLGGAVRPPANALSSIGSAPPSRPVQQPQPGTMGAPAAPQYTFATNPQTMRMEMVPGQPGYAYAIGPNNQLVAQRIPGAPGKGVTNKIEGGVALSLDNDDGHLVSRIEGAAPDTSKSTTIAGPNGNIIVQSGQVRGVVPFSTQPAQTEAWKADQARATQVAQQGTDAESQIQQALEGRNLAQGLPTGAGGESRAAVATWLKTYASPGVYQAFVDAGLPEASQSEEAKKVFLRQAALDEKTMGGSGGLGLTEKYAAANPGLNMTPKAIADMSNLKAITAQAAKDYSDGYLASFNKSQDTFLNQHGQYQPASNYDQEWHSQKNVATYMGAWAAMTGKPYAEWSKGLQGPAQDAALGVISRLDPTSIVNGPRGPIGVVKGGGQQSSAAPASAAPAVGTVMQGYRFNGGDPSNSASWAKVQ